MTNTSIHLAKVIRLTLFFLAVMSFVFAQTEQSNTGGAGQDAQSDWFNQPGAEGEEAQGEEAQDEQVQDEQVQSEEAQDAAEERIINIDFSGGSQRSESLRYGPLVYTHPDPEGLTATVSNLTIYAQNAELSAPDEVLIARAEGQREASFTGGVRVERGRLTATGPDLVYSESTGLGVMPTQTQIVVTPAEEGDAPVNITANEVTFDVDTDTSISRGDVTLTNGNQSAQAQELTFDEGRDLARLSSEGEQVTARRESEDGVLTITADVIRTNTTDDTLLATGNVTIVDGDITSTGDTVYFSDETSRAEVIGSPARSLNEAQGVTLTGARLEQRTDLDVVRVLDESVPAEFDPAQFDLANEQG